MHISIFQLVRAAPYCNSLFERLEAEPVTRVMWLNLKPLVRGKIPYAPLTPRAPSQSLIHSLSLTRT